MTKVPITLSCGCVTYFSRDVSKPEPGSDITCLICRAAVTVCYVPTGQWYWTCKAKKCKAGRNHGMSSLLALYGASAHNRLHPEHRIHVVNPDGAVRWKVARHEGQAMFDFGTDDHETRPAGNQDQQGSDQGVSADTIPF